MSTLAFSHHIDALRTHTAREFRELCQMVLRQSGCTRVSIQLVGQTQVWSLASSDDDAVDTHEHSLVLDRREAVSSHTLCFDESLIIRDLQEDARFFAHPITIDSNYRFLASVAIRIQGQIIGTLDLVHVDPNVEMHLNLIQTLESVTTTVGTALEKRCNQLNQEQPVSRRSMMMNLPRVDRLDDTMDFDESPHATSSCSHSAHSIGHSQIRSPPEPGASPESANLIIELLNKVNHTSEVLRQQNQS